MGRDLSRRKVAAYIAGAAFCAPIALNAQSVPPRPRSRPDRDTFSEIGRFVERTGTTGEVGVSEINLESGKIIYKRNQNKSFAPASALKVFTALYAMKTLGPSFQYSTHVLTDGSIKNSQVMGSLYLVELDDPMLDTDHLFALVKEVKAAGVRSVSGDLFYTGQKFPRISQIDPLQNLQARYNPSVSGLHLNLNRIYFEYNKSMANKELQLDARGRGVFPKTKIIKISSIRYQSLVYGYTETADKEM